MHISLFYCHQLALFLLLNVSAVSCAVAGSRYQENSLTNPSMPISDRVDFKGASNLDHSGRSASNLDSPFELSAANNHNEAQRQEHLESTKRLAMNKRSIKRPPVLPPQSSRGAFASASDTRTRQQVPKRRQSTAISAQTKKGCSEGRLGRRGIKDCIDKLVNKTKKRERSPGYTFEIRRPSESPPPDLQENWTSLQLQGPASAVTRFSDGNVKYARARTDEKKTVWASDKKRFVAKVISFPGGKQRGEAHGGRVTIDSEAPNEGEGMASVAWKDYNRGIMGSGSLTAPPAEADSGRRSKTHPADLSFFGKGPLINDISASKEESK